MLALLLLLIAAALEQGAGDVVGRWGHGKCDVFQIFGRRMFPHSQFLRLSGTFAFTQVVGNIMLRGDHSRDSWDVQALPWITSDYMACKHRLEGRFWRVTTGFAQNYSLICPGCLIDERLNSPWTLGLCVPRACSPSALRSLIVPALVLAESSVKPVAVLRRFTGVVRKSLSELVVTELADWSEIELSFAIIGFPGCGTSSLAINLYGNSDLEMLVEEEEEAYIEAGIFRNHWEPSRLHGRARMAAEMRPSSPALLPMKIVVSVINKWSNGRLTGFKNPIYYSGLPLARLARVPALRVVVLLADPAELFERSYLKSIRSCTKVGTQPTPPALADCIEVPCECWCHCAGIPVFAGNREFAMSKYLHEVVSYFGPERVFVATKDFLSRGRAFYDRVADFLGARPFPAAADDNWITRNKDFLNVSTSGVRAEVLAMDAERHVASMRAARKYFGEERAALRGIFEEVEPRWTQSELPDWLLEE